MRAAHELTDAQLAELARMSFRASRAPSDVVERASVDIDAWLSGASAESDLGSAR
jgi:adenosine deaminase